MRLSPKSLRILRQISKGSSYSQIVDADPKLSYLDIFEAASEAIKLDASLENRAYQVEVIRHEFPNAYKSWTTSDDEALRLAWRAGTSPKVIAQRFGRKVGAIHSRLKHLGLTLK